MSHCCPGSSSLEIMKMNAPSVGQHTNPSATGQPCSVPRKFQRLEEKNKPVQPLSGRRPQTPECCRHRARSLGPRPLSRSFCSRSPCSEHSICDCCLFLMVLVLRIFMSWSQRSFRIRQMASHPDDGCYCVTQGWLTPSWR